MSSRRSSSRSIATRLVLLVSLGACGLSTPTDVGEEIERDIEARLRSVAGDWTGSSTVPEAGALTLDFRLTESGTALTGSGTMRERAAPAARPITVSGTFVRPALSLTFDGMVYEGRLVRGSVRSAYTSVGGIADTLVLTGESYTKKLVVLLQER